MKAEINFGRFLIGNFDIVYNEIDGGYKWKYVGELGSYTTKEVWNKFCAPRNPKIMVDMDGVLCKYSEAHSRDYHPENNKYPQSKEGFFLNLEPIEGGIETLKRISDWYEIWFLTRPSYMNPLCYTEKRLWIEKYFGLEATQKLIICSDKSLVKGDYLIDDDTQHGQLDFDGKLLQYGSHKFPNWKKIEKYFLTLKEK